MTALVGMVDRYLGTVGPFDVPDPWWSHIEAVTAHLDRVLGVPCAVVRLLAVGDPDLGRGGTVEYHVEVADLPEPGALSRDGVLGAASWPAMLAGHPRRAWWARPSGPRELVRWAVDAVGRPLTGTPVQVKTWNLSCLYRLPMAGGTVWAKATAHFAGDEAAAIRLVRRHDESLAPEVLAADPARRRFVMRHVPGTDCWDAGVETVCDVVRRLVAVQAAIAGSGPSAAGSGAVRDARRAAAGSDAAIVERRPVALLDELPRLLDGELGGRLDPGELVAAGELVGRLPGLIAELESAGLPHSLVHGDLHPGNIVSDGSRHALVDWAEAHLGHPAFDINCLLRWLPAEQRDVVESAWADAWRARVPGSDPRRALPPVRVLGLVANAVLYQRFLDNIEPTERVYHESDPASELRLALRCTAGDGTSLRV